MDFVANFVAILRNLIIDFSFRSNLIVTWPMKSIIIIGAKLEIIIRDFMVFLFSCHTYRLMGESARVTMMYDFDQLRLGVIKSHTREPTSVPTKNVK